MRVCLGLVQKILPQPACVAVNPFGETLKEAKR